MSASRAKQALIKNLYGDMNLSFEKLQSYFDEVQLKNPGTHAVVESEEGSFRRSCFIPAFCIRAVEYCQPVIALDGITTSYCLMSNTDPGTHLKDLMNSSGILLVASAKDSNNHIVLLGFVLIGVLHALTSMIH